MSELPLRTLRQVVIDTFTEEMILTPKEEDRRTIYTFLMDLRINERLYMLNEHHAANLWARITESEALVDFVFKASVAFKLNLADHHLSITEVIEQLAGALGSLGSSDVIGESLNQRLFNASSSKAMLSKNHALVFLLIAERHLSAVLPKPYLAALKTSGGSVDASDSD